jgi:hypothetical protein
MSRLFHAFCFLLVVCCLVATMYAVASYEQDLALEKKRCPRGDCRSPKPRCKGDDYDACGTYKDPDYCMPGYCISKRVPPEDITCAGQRVPLVAARFCSHSLGQ